MRRFGFVLATCALASISSAALAQASATPPAASSTQPTAPAKAKALKRVTRAGTSTAGAHGFLPLPLGAFAAFAGWGAVTTAVVTQDSTPVSPE